MLDCLHTWYIYNACEGESTAWGNGVFGLGCIIHFAFAKWTCPLVCPDRANVCRWGVRLLAPLIGSILTETWPLQQMSVRFLEAPTKARTHAHNCSTNIFFILFSNVSLLFPSIALFALEELLQLLEARNTNAFLLGISTQQELRTFLALKRIWLNKFNFRMVTHYKVIKLYDAHNTKQKNNTEFKAM